MENNFVESNQCTGWLKDLKSKFRNTQIKAVKFVHGHTLSLMHLPSK
ncbi:hypothetical protein SAMN05660337_3248 [Maridesulfovibrio ferrireducens]|uniref:Uncharacterized protein n=1 Tax=Maridesulfovibrio ferrireducens TaxID=246191 RepID=A0A1G9KXD0_9BACT|nr:hypothetical protein SAMN05660337_3248 [Maridesulfovibrio ferrireducens]